MRRTFQDELLQGLDEEEDKKSRFDVGAEEPAPEAEKTLIEDELPEEVDIPQYTAPEPIAEEELPERQESKLQRYSNLLQRAATAGPSEADYRRAAISRAFEKTSASRPDYLAIMSKTLYNQPDFSGLAAAKRAGLGGKDYGIQAKEAEQRGLEGQAEALRKELLLPTEMADRESKALAVQAKLEQLKPASAEEIAAAEEALGTKIPPNITKADLAKMTGQATTQAIKGRGTPASEAQIRWAKSVFESAGQDPSVLEGMTTREELSSAISSLNQQTRSELAKQGLELGRARQETSVMRAQAAEERAKVQREERDEEQRQKDVVYGGKTYQAYSPAEGKELRNTIANTNATFQTIDDLKRAYSNLSINELRKSPQQVQEIGIRGKDLIMRIKEVYGLGAPQEGELKFLYSLIDASPQQVGLALLSDKIIGTSLPNKLDRLKDQFDRALKEAVKAKTIGEKKEKTSEIPSTPESKPARKVITDPNDL